MFYLLNCTKDGWIHSAESPWDSFEDALTFAEAECGLPWAIRDRAGTILALGYSGGETILSREGMNPDLD